jgi:hypothetical protein
VSPSQSEKAIQIARYFNVPVEVLHVADTVASITLHRLEQESRRIVAGGVKATWSVLCGEPWKVIVKHSSRFASPFVLLPIKYRHIMASDRVAAHVIRTSDVPVLTYSVR